MAATELKTEGAKFKTERGARNETLLACAKRLGASKRKSGRLRRASRFPTTRWPSCTSAHQHISSKP